MVRLKERRVLVTGASGSIGMEIAAALSREGAFVIAASRGGQKLRDAASRLKQEGAAVSPLVMDLLSPDSVREAIDVICTHWGGIDALVHCAGAWMHELNPEYLSSARPFYAFTAEQMRMSAEYNYMTFFTAAQAAMRFFLEQGEGRIVNVGMDEELFRTRGFSPLIAAKGASNALTLSIAAELEGTNITANLLTPGGYVRSSSMPANASAEHFGKLLDPSVLREPAVFLCSEQSRGVNGRHIVATRFREWLKEEGLEWDVDLD